MPSRQPLFPPKPHSKSKTTLIFLIITTFASLIIFFAILYSLYYLWYFLIHRSRTIPFDSSSPLVKLQRFTYKELKSATQGFIQENAIGKGGSGTVFRGILKDGKLVAIKLLDSNSLQAEREFQNELQVLGGLKLKSPFIVTLLGYCVEKKKRLVVYEYMPSRSLQESLFSESLSLNWATRYEIILDVAKALAFLHLECDPQVIHGDVKPSNVLLDSDSRAKLSDFGLSRVKMEGEFGVDFSCQDLGRSPDLWKSQDFSGNFSAVVGKPETSAAIGTSAESPNEVDFALALQSSSSSKNNRFISNVKSFNLNSSNCNGNIRNGKEVLTADNSVAEWDSFVHYDDELSSVEHSKELNLTPRQWGKNWWWKQDGSGELCSKDYVMEWIGSQICPSPNPDWDGVKNSPEKTDDDSTPRLCKFGEVSEAELKEKKVQYPSKRLGVEESNGWKPHNKKKKHRKMHEWWKEEHLNELNKKSTKQNKLKIKCRKHFKVTHLSFNERFHTHRQHKCEQEDQDKVDPKTEFSFSNGWKKKYAHSVGNEMWSGDLFSRELSSTSSMRGTLCYVAPEYGVYGYFMEKADIYSLGVLILVIVSGRRPLHILPSPMKLEKANLISWCRHLAEAGNILQLVDERLKDDCNKDQAGVCINLALACLQKMPELRPDISDVVKILSREMDLSSLPFDFSLRPSKTLLYGSRRKQKNRSG